MFFRDRSAEDWRNTSFFLSATNNNYCNSNHNEKQGSKVIKDKSGENHFNRKKKVNNMMHDPLIFRKDGLGSDKNCNTCRSKPKRLKGNNDPCLIMNSSTGFFDNNYNLEGNVLRYNTMFDIAED